MDKDIAVISTPSDYSKANHHDNPSPIPILAYHPEAKSGHHVSLPSKSWPLIWWIIDDAQSTEPTAEVYRMSVGIMMSDVYTSSWAAAYTGFQEQAQVCEIGLVYDTCVKIGDSSKLSCNIIFFSSWLATLYQPMLSWRMSW